MKAGVGKLWNRFKKKIVSRSVDQAARETPRNEVKLNVLFSEHGAFGRRKNGEKMVKNGRTV